MFAFPQARTRVFGLAFAILAVSIATFEASGQTLQLSTNQLIFDLEVGQPSPPPQTFQVMSTPAGAAFSARVDITIISADWLSLIPTNGFTPETITVNVDGSRFLTAGFRQADIIVRLPESDQTQVLRVTAQVAEPGTEPSIAANPGALTFVGSALGNPVMPQTLEVTNPGGGVLNYQIAVDYPLGASTGWLSINPANGDVSFGQEIHQVSVNTVGLPAGQHPASLVVTGNASNSPAVIPVTLNLGDAAEIAVTPPALTFGAPEGGLNPVGQTFTVSNGGGGILPYEITSDQPWLALRPVRGDATLGPVEHEARVNIENLPQGTYLANLTITSGAADNSPFVLPVTLSVGAPSSIFATPTRLDFVGTAGIELTDRAIVSIVNAPLLPGAWQAEVVQPEATWLKLSPPSGRIPGQLVVEVDTVGLGANTLAADIELTAINTEALSRKGERKDQSAATLLIPVRLALLNQAPVLGASPRRFLFRLFEGGTALSDQVLRVENFGGPVLNWRATITTENGLDWVGLARADGAAPSENLVTVNAAGLDAGVYQANINISAGAQNLDVPVTMVVSDNGPAADVDRSGVYIETVPDAELPNVPMSVSNQGGSSATWVMQTAGFTGGSVFAAPAPRTGTNVGGAAATDVVLSANADGLAEGLHGGLIELRSNSDDSPRYVSVMMNVLPQTRTPGRTVGPGGVSFIAPAASPPPAPQVVRVWRNEPGIVAFQTGANTFDGGGWLAVEPARGMTSDGGRADLQISVDSSALTPGTYRGLASIGFENGQVLSASVTTVVPEGGVFGCTASRVTVAPLEPAMNFSGVGTRPLHVAARLIDGCGDGVDDGAILATFSNLDEALPLESRGNGLYSATWAPRNPGSQITVLLEGVSGVFRDETGLVGNIGAGSEPRISDGGIVNGANFAGGDPLAPGTITSGFGINLATATTAAAAVPLPRVLEDTRVITAGDESPLYFSSGGQVNLQFPAEAAPNITADVLARNGDLYSVPEQVAVAAARPGLFVVDGRAIAQNQDSSINLPENAARRGEAVVLYLTGIGEVTPAVASGEAAPAAEPLARSSLVVEITIGGEPVQIIFVGMTPGFVGLAQANVFIPDDAPVGAAVEVRVTIDGQPSNVGTIAIAE